MADEYKKVLLNAEKDEIKHLKAIYAQAEKDILNNIRIYDKQINVLLKDIDSLSDAEKSLLQSKIYQRDYQKMLKSQIEQHTKDLNSKVYTNVTDYMKDCYQNAYIGTMHKIAKAGIPITAPFDEKAITRAMSLNSKLSKSLYESLGENVEYLKKRVANNIARGIATGSNYTAIARNIANNCNVGFNNAMRIARTEGHRVQILSQLDAGYKAQELGCESYKQWDSTLDDRVRPTHMELDGQIVAIDGMFTCSAGEVEAPSMFGLPEEDINCRCVLNFRPRWALDEDELQILKDRAEYYGLDKTDSFEEFKNSFLKMQNTVAVATGTATGINAVKGKKVSKIQKPDAGDKFKLTKLHEEAGEWYVSGEGMWINQYYRNPAMIGELSDNEKMLAKALDELTNSTTVQQKKLYRSVDASVIFGDMTAIEYENLRNALIYDSKEKFEKLALQKAEKSIGKEITEKGYMSTTKEKSIAGEFGGFTGSDKPVVLEINVPKGIKGYDMKQWETLDDPQKEVLLARNQKYRIKKITSDSTEFEKFIKIEVDLIPDKEIKKTSHKPKALSKSKRLKTPVSTANKTTVINGKTVQAGKTVKKATKPPKFEKTTTKFKSTMDADDYASFKKIVESDPAIAKLYRKADELDNIERKSSGGQYIGKTNRLEYSYRAYADINKYSTIAHEYGHYTDVVFSNKKLHYSEAGSIIDKIAGGKYFMLDRYSIATRENIKMSWSDEFLKAMRKDGDALEKILTQDLINELAKSNATAGLQDFIDGYTGQRILWGHGDRYYNRMWLKIMDKTDRATLTQIYKDLGLNVKTQRDAKKIARHYDTASELWANMQSAMTVKGEELKVMKKYMPETYKLMKKIFKGL